LFFLLPFLTAPAFDDLIHFQLTSHRNEKAQIDNSAVDLGLPFRKAVGKVSSSTATQG
jgi:hypothetical protein